MIRKQSLAILVVIVGLAFLATMQADLSNYCLAGGGGGGGGGYTPFANFTALTNSGWSWRNQGSSTVAFSGGVASITATGTGSFNVRIQEQTLPAAPWTVIEAFVAQPGMAGTSVSSGGFLGGMALDDGTKVKIYDLARAESNVPTLEIDNYTNATTYASSPASKAFQVGYLLWIKIHDDGTTNWTYYYSIDPVNVGWTLFFTEPRNTFLTPTSAGFAVDLYGVNGPTLNGDAVASWQITTP